MQITLETKPFATIESEALVSYVFEESDPIRGRITEIDQFTDGLLRKLANSGELTGKQLEMTLIHSTRGLKAESLLLVGGGKKKKFVSAVLRKIGVAGMRYMKTRSVYKFAFL